MKLWRMKMQTKLGSMLLLITTLLFLGFGVYQYRQIRTGIMDDLQSRAVLVVERLKDNLIIPIWDADINQVEKILLTEMRDPYVSAIVVKDHRSQILKAKYRNSQWEPADQAEMSAANGLTQTADILREKDGLGTLEVTVTFTFMQARLHQEIFRIVIVMLALDGLLFLGLALMTRHVIVRPLGQVADMAQAVAAGDFQTHVTVTTGDEIGDVARSFHSMEGKIEDVLQEISRVVQGIQHGDLNVRGNAEGLSGGWRELMLGINDLIQAFVTPISMMAQRIREISNGELPDEIHEEYHGDFHAIKEHLNLMLRTLRTFATNIRTVARQVADMSQDLSRNMEQLSNSVSQQAAATEEISATTEEMTSSILNTAGNARKTEEIALKSANASKEGALSVAEAIRAMQKIAKTLPTIEEIANRTNLLSLNASIEAAKAQEYGKGFAVVATEVRTLALQSQSAANEIKTLTDVMLQLAETANERLNRLLPDSQLTAELVQEISVANHEQSRGADQINQAIQQMDSTTQLHASIASSVAEMIQRLAHQAEQLRQTSEFFTLHDVPPEVADDVQTLLGKLQTASAGEDRIRMLTSLAHLILQEVESEPQAQEKTVIANKPLVKADRRQTEPSWQIQSLFQEKIGDDLDQEFERF